MRPTEESVVASAPGQKISTLPADQLITGTVADKAVVALGADQNLEAADFVLVLGPVSGGGIERGVDRAEEPSAVVEPITPRPAGENIAINRRRGASRGLRCVAVVDQVSAAAAVNLSRPPPPPM